MRMRHLAASGVTGLAILLMSLCDAHAGLWCPTPIPGVLMKYCLCESITGSAEVSSPAPLSPLKLFALRRNLNAAAMLDWVGRVQVRGGKRKFLSPNWSLSCDRERKCTTSRATVGGSAVYKHACYAKARPGPCGQRRC
jgi:hypothetical protein